MKLISTYSVKIKDHNHIFKESVAQYRSAVDFFIDVCIKEWDKINVIKGTKEKMSYVQSLSIPSKKHPVVLYDFNTMYYKMPVYLRRAAINEAIGKVSSYMSNLKNWGSADPRERGQKPSCPKTGYIYPCLYRGNMFVRTGAYTASIKVYRNNTWDWLTVELKKSDADYINRHCTDLKECAPTLQKRGKQWYLDFAFEQNVKLIDTPIKEQIILAVDLGLNNACTCSIMRYDGTVLGRRFLKLPREYDCLKRKVDHIKRAQRHGSRKVSNLWAYAKGVNDDIAVKTADFIIKAAILYDVDAIVFEHLDLNSKKKGKKQRLHLWKARYVQKIVEHKAHANRIHVDRICAWNTSRLAYDGSGKIKRGRESDKCQSYSVCEFQNGKVYNCDLNATYNIGARYFIREIIKDLPATERQRIEAKVPQCAKRSTCTLSDLINLCGALKPADLSYAA